MCVRVALPGASLGSFIGLSNLTGGIHARISDGGTVYSLEWIFQHNRTLKNSPILSLAYINAAPPRHL